MKTVLALIILLTSSMSFSQKDGKYLASGSPVDNLWEYAAGEGGAEIVGMDQQFFFLIPEGSEGSMMAPFEMEGMGFACPTYFSVSLDDTYLYLQIGEACEMDMPEEDKYVKVAYKLSADGKTLTLITNGQSFDYVEWQ
ncbi:MAG: hypothetical protein ACI865_000552 [Flavobacteriaceae bacterium]|jgi:hypothetical protein